ncbi:MAG: hypothetical protein F4Z21_03120 [Acidobacteria bacterium]|nr:hypothetical protein [Acidobacteriota bacterium]
MPEVYTIREYESFDSSKLHQADFEELKAVANTSWALQRSQKGGVAAANHVGIITTKRGTVLEILPKIDLGSKPDSDHETTRRLFLGMLRCWRRFLKMPTLPESGIRAARQFPMLEVFVRLFLDRLNVLARAGLARRYVPVEENLPYLRGRLLFREQIRENLVNRARFYVAHDELSVNRPANRLIHSALARLNPLVRNMENRRMLGALRQLMEVAEVPQAANTPADWQRHQVDRSMPHYQPVMQWVGLFLFGHGLATYSGRHRNLSLLFPMEQVFEDYVTHSFRQHLSDYRVTSQSPKKPLAKIEDQDAFEMRPDISLWRGARVVFILDAKWKEIDALSEDPKHGIDQGDLYQLYAYAKGNGCDTVALVYPRTQTFTSELRYRLLDDVTLLCLPFDVASPQESIESSMQLLEAVARR